LRVSSGLFRGIGGHFLSGGGAFLRRRRILLKHRLPPRQFGLCGGRKT
jgi:hypothetical protein